MTSGVRTLVRSTTGSKQALNLSLTQKNPKFTALKRDGLPPPPWPLAGTFMVARMLCRSLSWMGWAGLADPAAWEDGTGVDGVVAVGEAVEVAEGVTGVMGVVGTCEELTRLAAEVEVGVAAVDGLGEKNSQEGNREQLLKPPRNMIGTVRTHLSGIRHLVEEMLAAGTLLPPPRRFANPGPARAPRPPDSHTTKKYTINLLRWQVASCFMG